VLKANKSSAEPTGNGAASQPAGGRASSPSRSASSSAPFVVYSQTRFAQTIDAGYQREGLIQVGNMNRAAVAPLTRR
jgi:putative ABC transport system permease protein